MKRRILFGALFHETHTFLAETTNWNDFEVALGHELLRQEADESPAAGFLTAARSYGWEVVPTLAAVALPSGPVEEAVLENFWEEFRRRAVPALAAGIDAIFLVLHGAMATRRIPDVEGELLDRIRSLPGAATLPIFGVLDLHANVSRQMCLLANGLVAYRKNPHTDGKETGARAAALLEKSFDQQVIPRMSWCRIPVIWAPPGTGSDANPMRALRAFADETEKVDPSVWSCNVAPGFSFADTAETGLTLSLVSVGTEDDALKHLERGAHLAWELRATGVISYPSVAQVLENLPLGGGKIARSAGGKDPASGPILLVEPADNIGAGAPGDGTGILRAFLAKEITGALVAINDPDTVRELAGAALGESRQLAIGGRGWPGDEGPVEIAATLISHSAGNFQLEDPQSHLASMSGLNFEMGPCAVVRARGVTILLTSRKTPPFDLGQFRSQGIDPAKFAFVGVKAAVAHRRAYDPIARAAFFVDTPGPCSSNLSRFPFQRLRRPVYPLDPITAPHFAFA